MTRLTSCLLLAAALFTVGVLQAHADMDYYTNTRKQDRSTDVLHADMQTCAQKVGPTRNGQPTSRAYKACMRGHGWRFDHTEIEETWTDPETGLPCKAVGIAAVCSNF